MTRALVTGATGFIGPHLVRELRRQDVEVACLRRAASAVEQIVPLGVRLHEGDITNLDTLGQAIDGANVVFHLAGLTRALSRRQLHAVNVEGTRNVLTACAAATNPPVVVVVSSLAAAGPSPSGKPRSEEQAPAPVSQYGRSKRAAEIVAHEFADRLPITVVRPPLVFGQGDPSVLAMFRPIRRFGVHLVPGYADRRLSVIHAADLAAALVAAGSPHALRIHAQSAPPGGRGGRLQASGFGRQDLAGYQSCSPEPEVRSLRQGYYHVACDEHPTYAEWGGRIATALGRRTLVVRTPEWVAWGTAGLNEIVARVRRWPHVFNWDKAREATAGSWICSAERAKRELGWSCAAHLDARLAETVAWYRRQGWL
jgi:nucleoside-diphosphate-sugar epimerase